MMPNDGREFYLKGIYAVEVVSDVKDGLVDVRAKTTFLHTSNYSKGRRQFRVGTTPRRWVKKGEVLTVPLPLIWSHRRRVAQGHA